MLQTLSLTLIVLQPLLLTLIVLPPLPLTLILLQPLTQTLIVLQPLPLTLIVLQPLPLTLIVRHTGMRTAWRGLTAAATSASSASPSLWWVRGTFSEHSLNIQ